MPGLAIGVVHNDEVVFLKGFGLRDAGRPETVSADTVFQIASLSKPVSSTIVAALVSEGVVSWDSRIADLDPAFRLAEPYPTSELTVRDLFAHRSGLPGSAGDDLEDIGFRRDEILRRLRFVRPQSSFRSAYSYSNFGLTEGAVAAAGATGKSWEEVADIKLYQPLGMRSTSSRHADFLARSNRAALHIKVQGAWVTKIERDPDAQSPSGGVSSSARDLAEWMRLQLGNGLYGDKRLIAAMALEATHVSRHGPSWSHAGAFSVGARSVATLYPRAKLGIVVLANAFPSGVPEGIAETFADLAFDGRVERDWVKPWDAVYESLFGPAVAAAKAAYASPPAATTPALAPRSYAGRYSNVYFGDVVVTNENGTLVLKVGPNAARSYALRHFNGDLFLAFPDAETPDRPTSVRFAIGPDGKSSAATIEFLNGNDLGTFRRIAE